MEIIYRHALPQDAQELQAIYSYYVEHTVATFRTVCLTAEHYREKIETSPYPFWVAVGDGAVLGFAYAEILRPHDAYRWDVELTIYLKVDAPGRQGMGSALYHKLLPELAQMGFYNAYAVITGSNENSIRFHERFGFEAKVRFEKMGFKHGEWHDAVWMHKLLRPIDEAPEPPVPFRE